MASSSLITFTILGFACFGTANPHKRLAYPTVKSITQLGDVSNPSLNRDSCSSVRVGDRALWTCRDTQNLVNGSPTLPVWSSSASWTNIDSNGPELFMYSDQGETPFYPYGPNECGSSSAGVCSDGSRYALWPNQPPLITSVDGTTVTGYTWIPDTHIKGLTPVSGSQDPGTSLYKFVYDYTDSNRNALPSPQLLNENFFGPNVVPYGSYGSVVRDGVAYLFGQPSNKNVCLAKVPTGSVGDLSQYQYYVNGAWTSDGPVSVANSKSCNINNVSAGGQGTYYFSTYWNKWVWIGQPGISVSAYFMVTTADNIEGPWASPEFFYQGANGNYSLSAYSLQAQPGLFQSGQANQGAIYITWTKVDSVNNQQIYTTPLVLIEWNPFA